MLVKINFGRKAMEKPSWSIQIAVSSLAGLILLQAVLLGSLWAQVQPHPPAKVGPFIAASLSLTFVSIPLVWWRNKIGYTTSIIVGLLGLISFGPHKFFSESAVQIFPAILVGTVLSVVLIISSLASWRTKK
jgi:hypothetical protein